MLRLSSTDDSSVLINNLVLNGKSVNSEALSDTKDSGAKYFEISGIENNAFTLKGTTTLNFTRNTPRGSHLAYQFKVTNKPETEETVSVPEPGTVLGMLFSVGALGTLRRNKKSVSS